MNQSDLIMIIDTWFVETIVSVVAVESTKPLAGGASTKSSMKFEHGNFSLQKVVVSFSNILQVATKDAQHRFLNLGNHFGYFMWSYFLSYIEIM